MLAFHVESSVPPPRQSVAAKPDSRRGDHAGDSTEGRVRVLVAEDEPALRRLLVEILLQSGCEVRAVGDGRQALRLLLQPETYSLVILDEELPGLGGRGLLGALRSAGVRVPEILWSGSLVLGDEERTALGVGTFLRKPASLDALEQAIRSLLAESAVG
jgi:CheY-like chemotaxis protein